jgi:hypothetical protein
MIKQVVLLSALCTGTAWAQQNLDISEKDVASGAAQARLSAVARQAASSGKRVVVTAPQHLHAQIAAGLAAGGKADVVLRDGFYENVLVRVEEKAEEVPKPEVKPAPKPAAPTRPAAVAPPAAAPRPAPAPAPERVSPPAPAAATTAPAVATPPPAPTPRPAAAPAPSEPVDLAVPPPPPPSPARAAPPRVVEEAATEAEPAAAAGAQSIPGMFVAAEPGDLSPSRTSLEKLYNEGRRIKETITPERLINGDVIYLGNGAAVVVRRDRPLLLRFWLEGTLDLGQSALEAEGRNKVRVIGTKVR